MQANQQNFCLYTLSTTPSSLLVYLFLWCIHAQKMPGALLLISHILSVWEQLMNQGKEVEISVPSQPMFDSSEQKASGSTTTSTTGTE